MFDPLSRYANMQPYPVTDARGRQVMVVPPPPPPDAPLMGIHLLRQGERTDLLAMKYNGDPAGYWRIAEQNDAMLPEALAEKPAINIPVKQP